MPGCRIAFSACTPNLPRRAADRSATSATSTTSSSSARTPARLSCWTPTALPPASREPPAVVLAGTGHLAFVDPDFEELNTPALVPSYATGSPYTREHLFACLKAAARPGLRGAIVEFGAFKGGTTAWLARVAAHLGLDGCRVIGLDSWAGFPPRRSVLDLYEHPRCVFTDLDAVRAYVEPFGVELIAGDITDTYRAARWRTAAAGLLRHRQLQPGAGSARAMRRPARDRRAASSSTTSPRIARLHRHAWRADGRLRGPRPRRLSAPSRHRRVHQARLSRHGAQSARLEVDRARDRGPAAPSRRAAVYSAATPQIRAESSAPIRGQCGRGPPGATPA